MDATDEIGERFKSMALGGTGRDDQPVQINERHMKVFISIPSVDGEDYIGRRPKDFGPVSKNQARNLQIELQDKHGNLIPAPLLDQHIWNDAGTAKLSGKDASNEARKILREQNVPVDLWPKRVAQGKFSDSDGKEKNRYQLRGEEQFQLMPDGTKRLQSHAYENQIATGAFKGDAQAIYDDGVVYLWRKKGDGVTIESLKRVYAVSDDDGNIVGVPRIAVTASTNVSHSSEFIDLHKEEWGVADKRLKGRTSESVSDRIPEVLVTFKNGRQFDADLVLQHMPGSLEAEKLRTGPGPDETYRNIPINVRNVHGNNWDPIETVHAQYPTYLQDIARNHGMYTGSWASLEAGEKDRLQLTKAENTARFDRYRHEPPARAWFAGAMVPLDDPALIDATKDLTPQERMKAYPLSSITLTVIGKQGGIGGSQRVMSSYGGKEAMPESGFDAVRAFYTGDHTRATPARTETFHALAMPGHIRNAGRGIESFKAALENNRQATPSPRDRRGSTAGSIDMGDAADVSPEQAGMMNSFPLQQNTPAPTPNPPRVYDSRDTGSRNSGHDIS
ncbi:hypothetical protein AM571_PA00265 (plasmid) [Rhizobium etli 8C-3]|uniref:Uncharacterized protein n=1 Tax=Rhizobium etli 8C-3 TaxID=538025 RepID=A0A1L5PAD9_RHIET|nr:hypothetical protein [Rhizobium etli]APO77149.1 hypothetical protein AM571_PA00265 [Rhizobium etli 8C-3]